MLRASARLCGLFAAGMTLACGAASPRGARPAPGVAAARYEVSVASTEPWVLSVAVTVSGGADRLVATAAPEAVQAVEVEAGGRTTTAERRGESYRVECPSGCTIRYRVDLSQAAAGSGDDPAIAIRSAGDIVAPASTWLLRPEPLAAHVPLEVAVHDAAGVRFASGFATWRPCARAALGTARPGASAPGTSASSASASGTSASSVSAPGAAALGAAAASGAPCAPRSAFELRSQELRTAGYTAFGTFGALRAEGSRGAVDIAVLGGARAADDGAIVRWVERMARTMDRLFGRFPVPRAQLFIVPQPGAAEVTWGRTLPSGGFSILVTLGALAREEDLADDWILVHEMIHLGVPSFWREGRWLDEGLATYYEPVLRTRAGLRSDLDLWTEFATQMPRGVGEPGGPSLAEATAGSRVYWGGATFALRADTLIRGLTGGARSLDDGLRAALDRGANATRIWSLDAYLDAIDDAVGLPVMRDLYARVAEPPVPACVAVAAADSPPRLVPSLLALPAPRAPRAASGLVPAASCASPDGNALGALLRDLGVARSADGAIALEDQAPLAAVRRAIARGGANDVLRAELAAPRPDAPAHREDTLVSMRPIERTRAR